MTEIIIDKRFCGPKDSGNGGYSAGLFASMIDGPAEVTLKSPPPLDAVIELRDGSDGTFEAVHGERVIAIAKPAIVEVEAPPCPAPADVRAAHDAFLSNTDGEHLIPYCFVCGDRRAPGDGLRIFSGPMPDSVLNADFWTPANDLASEDGLVRSEFLWAALDCPSAFTLRDCTGLILLGRIAVIIKSRPKPGDRLVAAAWPRGREGRKYYSSCALYDQNGAVIAAANATWIELDDRAMIAKLEADRKEDQP